MKGLCKRYSKGRMQQNYRRHPSHVLRNTCAATRPGSGLSCNTLCPDCAFFRVSMNICWSACEGMWMQGGTGLMRQCQRVKTLYGCACVYSTCVCMCVCASACVVSKQRCGVHSAFTKSVMQTERQSPFSWSASMFYLSGVAKQAVCLTQQQQQQQQKSQHAFSSAPLWAGNFFVSDVMWWKMSARRIVSLNKQRQLLWPDPRHRPKERDEQRSEMFFNSQ